MSVTLTPGAAVVSRRFGPAIVQDLSPAGVLISCAKLGMAVRVPLDDVEPSGPEASGSQPKGPDGPSSGPPPHSSLRASIEALRFGIVPSGQIRRVTVGFDKIAEWTTSRFPNVNDGRPTFSEVCAPFGFGKSHNIEAIRALARDAGYVVAHTELNGQDVTFADPVKLLVSLWSNVELPNVDAVHPLWEIHKRALQRNPAGILARMAAFERIHSNLQTVETLKRCSLLDDYEEKLEGLLSGNLDIAPTYLRAELFREISDRDDRRTLTPMSLIGKAVDDRPEHFVEALLGYAALCQWAGFKGLVITLDEFETEYVGLSDARLERIFGVFTTLAKLLKSANKAIHAPLAIFIASVGQGGTSQDPMLKVVASSERGESRALPAWDESSLMDLAKNLHSMYCDAYGISTSFRRAEAVSLVSSLKADEGVVQIRQFIRNYIAAHDQRYGPPA